MNPVITPDHATVVAGGKQQFKADQEVTWSLQHDSTSGGTIDGNGLYTAGNPPSVPNSPDRVDRIVAKNTQNEVSRVTVTVTMAKDRKSLKGPMEVKSGAAEQKQADKMQGKADDAQDAADDASKKNKPALQDKADVAQAKADTAQDKADAAKG